MEAAAAAAEAQPTTYGHFLKLHRAQLEAIGLPEGLWKVPSACM